MTYTDKQLFSEQYKVSLMIMFTRYMINTRSLNFQARRNRGGWGGCSPQIFAKVDLFKLTMIENDGEKKKGAKKDKPYQIPRKLLLTLPLSM